MEFVKEKQIVSAENRKKKIKGEIKVLIDKENQRIIVIDNGTGFL